MEKTIAGDCVLHNSPRAWQKVVAACAVAGMGKMLITTMSRVATFPLT